MTSRDVGARLPETFAVSAILPAKNEAQPLEELLPKLRRVLPSAEIIVVDDGSSDATAEVARRHGAKVVRHPYSMGNGASIKAGSRAASGDVLVLLDADGQHDPASIPALLTEYERGFDMVVGCRSRSNHATIGRRFANAFYNRLATYMTGQPVKDLTSGFRVVDAEKFREFLYLLPNGFSYPTTSTMAFFRAGYRVAYAQIDAAKRVGKSHIRPVRDGLRFLLIIFKIGTLYSPLKLYCPVSAAFFVTGLGHYLYTYITAGRFTNMSALMFTASVLIFMIGLVSEQITQLIYRPTISGHARTDRVAQDDSIGRQSPRRETGT